MQTPLPGGGRAGVRWHPVMEGTKPVTWAQREGWQPGLLPPGHRAALRDKTALGRGKSQPVCGAPTGRVYKNSESGANSSFRSNTSLSLDVCCRLNLAASLKQWGLMKANLEGTNSLIYSLQAKDKWIFSSHLLLCNALSFGHLGYLMSFCLFYSFCSLLPNQNKVKCEPKSVSCSFPLQWGSWAGLCLSQVTKQKQTWQCPLTAAWERRGSSSGTKLVTIISNCSS